MERKTPDDGEHKPIKKKHYDDFFMGNADDILPKTTRENPDVEKILRNQADKDLEIEKVRQQALSVVNGEIDERRKKVQAEMETAITEFYDSKRDLEKQSESLPIWQAYLKFREENFLNSKNPFGDFEKSFKGKLLRNIHLFAMGTESGWWKKVTERFEKNFEKANALGETAYEEREKWQQPFIDELENIKNRKISEAYDHLLFYDVTGRVFKEADKHTKIQKQLRDPENPRIN